MILPLSALNNYSVIRHCQTGPLGSLWAPSNCNDIWEAEVKPMTWHAYNSNFDQAQGWGFGYRYHVWLYVYVICFANLGWLLLVLKSTSCEASTHTLPKWRYISNTLSCDITWVSHDPQDTTVKQNLIRTIDLIGRALHPDHLKTNDFVFSKRGDLINHLLGYIRAEPINTPIATETRSLAIRGLATLTYPMIVDRV